MAGEDVNYALVCQKIDTLRKQVDKLENTMGRYTEVNENRVRQLEINCTLLEQQNRDICKDIESNRKIIENTSLLTKLFGAISGFLAIVATAIALLKGVF